MARKKTTHARKQSVSRSKKRPVKKQAKKKDIRTAIVTLPSRMNARRKAFLKRRPHRSFQLTRRRDYRRSLKLPGYIALTIQVFKLMWKHRWQLAGLALFYMFIAVLFSSLVSEESYRTVREVVGEQSGAVGMSKVLETVPILFGAITSQANQLAGNSGMSGAQQVAIPLLGVFTWLTAVWLLRNWMAKRHVKVRDGLYSAGAPLIPTLLIAIIFIIQLLPGSIGVLLYVAAQSTELLQNTGILMLFAAGSLLLVILSLYWMTTTWMASIIVTIPGMYPLRAMKLAGDIVVGRRVRLLLRILWQFLIVVVLWIVILIPVIWLDAGLKAAWSGFDLLPLVPLTLLILSTYSVLFIATYTYTLYRKVVKDDAAPA